MKPGYGGEYYEEGPESAPLSYAREAFLETVRRLAPEVLTSLRREIFEARGQLSETELEEKVAEWTSRHHLNAEWVLDRARLTLFQWSVLASEAARAMRPNRDNDWAYAPVSGLYNENDSPDWKFSHFAWNPRLWTRAMYEDHALPAVKYELKAYCDRVEARSVADGLRKTPVWRDGAHTSRSKFEWLVRWQVQGWTKSEIAQSYKIRRNDRMSSLVSGLEWAAEQIGLPLRVGKPGRPRKG